MNLILFKKFLVKFWSTWYSFIQCAVKKWSIWLYKLYLTFTDYQILEVLVYSSVQFMSHFYLWRKMGKGRHRFSRVKNFLTSYTDIWKYWSNLFTYTNPPDGRVSVTRESKRQKKKREKLNQKSGTSFERREKILLVIWTFNLQWKSDYFRFSDRKMLADKHRDDFLLDFDTGVDLKWFEWTLEEVWNLVLTLTINWTVFNHQLP